MKKIIKICLLLVVFSNAFADGMAHLKLKIKGATENNAYFLCLYGSGCYSMRAGANGRIFPIHTYVLANQKKIFITNIKTRRLYSQAISGSCLLKLNSAQTVTITGSLKIKNNKPMVDNLSCTLA